MTTGAQTVQSRQFFPGKADSQPPRQDAPTASPSAPNKPRDRVQPAKDKGLSALLATGSMACYAGRNPKNLHLMRFSLIYSDSS
jgi:hypothetical protein